MRYLLGILFALTIIGCSTAPKAERSSLSDVLQKRGPYIPKPVIPEVISYDSLDISVRKSIQTLDSIYGTTPYYANLDGNKFYIVIKGKTESSNYYQERFSGRYQYGVIDSALKLILPFEYDKIYNPNLTAMNCMEIKKGGKLGLFNFSTHQVLEPQFEFIAPSSSSATAIAYGYKAGGWHKIDCNDKFKISPASFDADILFRSFSFDAKLIDKNMLYSTYNFIEDGPYVGCGVVFTPSYIEHLDIMPEVCTDLVLSEQKSVDFGTHEANIKTDSTRSIANKAVAFLMSFYTSGIDGRGFVQDSKNLIVYNKTNQIFSSVLLRTSYPDYNDFCGTHGYRFVNDTLIEVLWSHQVDSTKKDRYIFEKGYTYTAIAPNGGIEKLHSNRYYNFTKYVDIDQSYFTGCFATYLSEAEANDSCNFWNWEHLTSDDLDLMINEIYAEYGYRFKTDKWKDYFSKLSWYKPQYDNVDNILSPRDKKNIEIIVAEKANMKGKENEFVKKRKVGFHPAG